VDKEEEEEQEEEEEEEQEQEQEQEGEEEERGCFGSLDSLRGGEGRALSLNLDFE